MADSPVLWWLLLLAASAVSSGLLTSLVRRAALERSLLDHPNARSSHTRPTPRGGGVAIVIVVLFGGVALALAGRAPAGLPALLTAGLLIAAVGFLDDLQDLSIRIRLPIHFAAAAWIAWLGADSQLGLVSHAALLVVVTLGLTWALNLFNFMDGIDGIAAVEAAFVMLAGAFLVWLADGGRWVGPMVLAAGASLGFLVFNWQPAKIFMGDAGSGFLGFFLAGSGYLASSQLDVPLASWIILGAVFIVDSTVTLVTRALTGQRFLTAHRSHAYQRLARRWNSHARVSAGVIAVNAIWLLPLALVAYRYSWLQWPALGAAIVPGVVFCVAVGAGRPEN